MSRQLDILVFAYVYPPDAGSGTFRTLYFANHWAVRGDNVTVVTVRRDHFLPDAAIDEELGKKVHPTINVIRATAHRPLQRLIHLRKRFRGQSAPQPAQMENPPGRHRSKSAWGHVKDSVTTVLEFPDAHNGWIFDAVRQGLRIAKRKRPDCVYASGGPWSTLLAASIFQRLTGVPLVLDFRDPWSSNPNLAARGRLGLRAHAYLENFCVKRARRVITNTNELRAEFAARYPRIEPRTFVCITNGFEEIPIPQRTQGARLDLVHAGALYLSRNPLNFLKALAQVIDQGLVPRDDVAVHFIGGLGPGDAESAALLERMHDVVEVTPRVPHAIALAAQQRAGALLLFQSGFPLQIPRKLYEYLSLDAPILAIAEANSATARVLADVGLDYSAENNVADIAGTLLRLYRDWRSGTLVRPHPNKVIRYKNRHLAGNLRDEMLSSLPMNGPP
jgi:glycosyltransferase involved in cell wall biosynthesis